MHAAMTAFIISAFVCLLAASPPVRAAEQCEDMVVATLAGEETILFQEIPSVFGASKYEQKTTEAPASVTIITADEIKKYGYRTLADVLRSVPGFFVTSDRNYHYLGIRGFNRPGDYNTRVLLLVDGHRLNNNIFDQARIGTESTIDVDLIDQVEIIRGPSSSLYGTNAFLGVINVITKRGRDVQGVEVSGEGASRDSYKGRVTYGNRFANGLEVLLSGTFYDSQGDTRLFYKEFDSPLTNNGVVHHADDDQAYNLFSKFSLYDFTLQSGYVSRDKTIPTAAFNTVFNTDRSGTTDEHGYADLRYNRLFAGQWNVLSRLFYDAYYYRGNYLTETPANERTPLRTLNRDKAYGEWWGGEVQVTKKVWDRHTLIAGLEYQNNYRQDQSNADLHPRRSVLDDRRDSQRWALYLQGEFSILDNLLLNLGVRRDEYDFFNGTTNPRLALIYNYKQKTTFKVLYGQAFRAPNVYERFYTASDFQANPHLRPEEIETQEFVIEHHLDAHVRGSLSLYRYTIDDLISLRPNITDGLLAYRNISEIKARGLELSLEGQWPNGLEGRISYALQRVNNTTRGPSLTNSPRHLAKFNLIVPLIADQLFAGIEAYYMSERKTLAGHTASDFAVVNATLFHRGLFKGVELTAAINNLFDRDYDDLGLREHRQDLIQQDGRTFWLKLKYSF